VVPLGSKALFGMAGVTLAASILYGGITQDGSAAAPLGVIAVGAFVLGVMVLLADPDKAPWYAPDAPLAEQSPVGGRPAAPSLWPFVGALALGILALGAATDGVVVLAAVVVMTIVALGWLVQHWVEDPTYTPGYGARVRDRLILPIGLPVAVVGLVAVIAISLSRVFLALPEDGTRAAALAVAVVILVSGFVVAASERMGLAALRLLCALALVCAVGAGAAGLVHGERKFEVPNTPAFHGKLPLGINPTVIAILGQKTAPTTTTTTLP